jgi:hypothetical protein
MECCCLCWQVDEYENVPFICFRGYHAYQDVLFICFCRMPDMRIVLFTLFSSDPS